MRKTNDMDTRTNGHAGCGPYGSNTGDGHTVMRGEHPAMKRALEATARARELAYDGDENSLLPANDAPSPRRNAIPGEPVAVGQTRESRDGAERVTIDAEERVTIGTGARVCPWRVIGPIGVVGVVRWSTEDVLRRWPVVVPPVDIRDATQDRPVVALECIMAFVNKHFPDASDGAQDGLLVPASACTVVSLLTELQERRADQRRLVNERDEALADCGNGSRILSDVRAALCSAAKEPTVEAARRVMLIAVRLTEERDATVRDRDAALADVPAAKQERNQVGRDALHAELNLLRVSQERDHQAWLTYDARRTAAARGAELTEVHRMLGGTDGERVLTAAARVTHAVKRWADAKKSIDATVEHINAASRSLFWVAEFMRPDALAPTEIAASAKPEQRVPYRGILAGLAPTDEQVEAEAKRLSAFLSTAEWNATETMEGWRETWRAVARDVLSRRGAK